MAREKTVEKQKIVTPKGELLWVNITGQGKENFDGDGMEYTATVVLTEDEADEIQEIVDEFYVKSGGREDVTPNKIIREDEDGRPIISFKTQTEFDGKKTYIKVVDGRNKEVHLPEEIGIGNGSVGKIAGTLSYYRRKQSDGVSLFLNSVKLLELIKYTPETGFEDDDEDEGGFSADDIVSGYDGDTRDEDEPEEKPKRSRRASRKPAYDGDEPETPKRSRRASSKSDEDDEDAPETTRRSRRSRR